MLNQVVLIGRLGADPELRYTPSGAAVCNFSVAVERNYANSQGEREVDWIDIVVWRKAAESSANHLEKGSLVAIQGRMQVRYYETNEGQKRKVTEVVANDVRFLDWSKNKSDSINQNTHVNTNNNSNNRVQSIEEDIEVPF